MKGTVTLENGKVIEIEINEEQLKQMQVKIKTGYERLDEDDTYYYVKSFGRVDYLTEQMADFDNKIYDTANYYSDPTVAENNARADKLFRQLRRFAVENRKVGFDWKNRYTTYYKIIYRHWFSTFCGPSGLEVSCSSMLQDFGGIYFDTEEVAEKAIKTFHDELIWYFTEYKDSL